MRNRLFVLLPLLCCIVKLTAQPTLRSVSSLKLIGVKELPHNLLFQETTVGGLSGIDYDAAKQQYYMICDDRSSINPARYYTAKLFFTANGVDSIAFTAVHSLLQPEGSVYPGTKQDPANTPDPEALRYDAKRKRMVWSSEGERIIRGKDTILENPAVTVIQPDGKFTGSFPLPKNLWMRATENGPRQNGVLEGMSFSDDYRYLWVNLEEPRYEDGPRAETTPNQAMVRFYKFDAVTKKNLAQYAYQLEPVAYPSTPPTAFKVNGIPDILHIGNNRMLVMERSFSTGILPCTIKIFLADLNGAENIMANPSLIRTPAKKTIRKKLLLNMDELGVYVDNVEGMTLGPVLPNGHRTLVMVADNNFASLERTQFFVFEILP
jgi:hypothetical protein